MRILFAHKNFPAQFGGLAHWLTRQGWDVVFATLREDVPDTAPYRIVKLKAGRDVTKGIHPFLVGTEQAVIASQVFARGAAKLKQAGFTPDLVVGHSGWGTGAFASEIWPRVKFVPYMEWYYAWPPRDRTPHDSEPKDAADRSASTKTRNLPFLLDLSVADAALCPTRFQAAQFPDAIAARLTVIHDGIDTQLHAPGPADPGVRAELGIPGNAEVLTWVTRGMEPVRGFPEMMAALAALQARRPNLHAVIVGADRVAYGSKSTTESWKSKCLAELDLDRARVHFTGLVSRKRMIEILRLGDVHLFLTVPFVLSWSLLDAMSTGAAIVASDVDPVREVITHGEHGLLAPTYDHQALVGTLARALDDPDGMRPMRDAARARIVQSYDAKRVIYPRLKAFFETVAARDRRFL